MHAAALPTRVRAHGRQAAHKPPAKSLPSWQMISVLHARQPRCSLMRVYKYQQTMLNCASPLPVLLAVHIQPAAPFPQEAAALNKGLRVPALRALPHLVLVLKPGLRAYVAWRRWKRE